MIVRSVPGATHTSPTPACEQSPSAFRLASRVAAGPIQPCSPLPIPCDPRDVPVQIELGAAKPARITKYTAAGTEVDPPHPCGSDRIKRIRAHMALSQSVFAAALNVSPETVEAWEQGKREPDRPSLRLLEVAEEHPEVLLAQVRVTAS